jgi:DNA-binding XRE family transcriptional regulator
MVNDIANGTAINTIADYMNDETSVSPADRERINFKVSLIGKMIEAREEKGLSQREPAGISGVKQPAIARLESMKATPQTDTLFKVLHPLGYTIEIVPLQQK